MEIRNKNFDTIKGILILLVIFGHFLISYHSYLSSILLRFIYSFHMPFFAFISGYFSKKKSNIFKYIYLYIIFNTLYYILSSIYENINYGFFNPYYSMWYILSLSFWRILSNTFNFNSKKWLIISITISLLIGFFQEVNSNLTISRTICFLPFFISGYIYRDYNIKSTKNHLLTFIPFLIIIISFVLIVTNKINMQMLLMNNYNNYIDDLILRIIIFISAFSFIYIFIKYIRNITFFNEIGKRSLQIYIFHRIFPIIIINSFFYNTNNNYYLILFFILSLVIAILLSNFFFEKLIYYLTIVSYKILDIFHQPMSISYKRGNILHLFLTILFCEFLISIPYIIKSNEVDYVYKKANYNDEKLIKNSVRISFIGDLILLKKQIEYNKIHNIDTYDYIFYDTKKILSESDYSIGVLEGPVAGKSLGYTNSNFDDNIKKLEFNFPIEFAKSIKNSGIDLVSTSNNHLMDKNLIGLKNTINNLNKIKLDYTGSYLNKYDKEKHKIKLINVRGIKIAILSYTYGLNYHNENEILTKYSNNTSYLTNPESKYFNTIKNSVKNDFKLAKNLNPDLIIVMPHMGTQFSHKQDYYQKIWNKIFVDNGANIILGDHSHTVQPIEYINNVPIINSPGNFINSYLQYNGDLGSIVNIYINKKTKKVFSTSIIPTIIKNNNGRYETKIIYNSKENKKIDKSNRIITSIMLNKDIGITRKLDEYFLINNTLKSFYKPIIHKKNINKNSKVYKMIEESNSITFIGDSITTGSKNGGFGYYEPIINYFTTINKRKKICTIAQNGATTSIINKLIRKKKCKSDLYVIAIGTNNIRYKWEKNRTPNEYIASLKKIISKLHSDNIIIISPFISNDNDVYFTAKDNKLNLFNKYNNTLKMYCSNHNYTYININKEIYNIMRSKFNNKYMLDYIHPNNSDGIILYSELILNKS